MMPWRFPRRWLLLALLLPVLLYAAAAVPKLARHVTDLTGTLTTQQVDQLDAQLTALERAKGAQLVVLMVGSTGEQDIEGYSLAVAEANKVGRKGVDDGLLLLIAKDDRRVRIEVGYGLEGAIPDAATARIIREYIAPKFRSNDYFGGISDAVGALTQLVDGEAHTERMAELPWPSFLSSKQVRLLILPPDSMPPVELFRYIHALKADDQQTARLEQAFWTKVGIPLSMAAMVLVATPFVFGPPRARTGGQRLAIGVAIGIVFSLTQQITSLVGLLLDFSPLLAAIAPSLLLIGATQYYTRRAAA